MGCGKNPTCWHQSSRLLIQVWLAKVQSQHKDEAQKRDKRKVFPGKKMQFLEWNSGGEAITLVGWFERYYVKVDRFSRQYHQEIRLYWALACLGN